LIFLLNNERVILEMMSLARFKLAQMLGIEPNLIKAEVGIEDGRLLPHFDISNLADTTKEQLEPFFADIWINQIKPEFERRMQGLTEVR
jgi:hypothetical protein